ncbi:MAG TPA: diacylglycerol kinase family protein [Dehalococcoidia bacterium]|nr:diacylglycerol kinase family protein [Dehalococcoidia bacterium]
MRKAAVIYNPAARTAPKRQRLHDAAASLEPDGWQVELLATEAAGHATQLAREAAAAGAEVVFACGGDGTINEVVNGLVHSQTALGALRAGMGNVFVKEIGMPRAPAAALRVLLDGELRRFDLGLANGRYFLLMASIGIDANVVKRVPNKTKRLLGSISYELYGLLELVNYKPQLTTLKFDGQTWQGDLFWALFGNTRSYGGVLNITSRALVDDGLLDAYVFEGQGPGWVASTLLRVIGGRHEGASGVSYVQAREIEVETPGLPVQADGEYFGQTPMRFSVVPAALDVLLPRGKAERLFGKDT